MPILTRSKPLYVIVLKEAWRFSWHHPLLWVFGFFAAFLGHTGVLEIITALLDSASGKVLSTSVVTSAPTAAIVMPTIFGSRILGLVGEGSLVVVAVALGILIIVAAVGSSGALIHAAHLFRARKLETLRASWHHGVAHFWSLFWLNIGKKVFLALMVLLVSLPLLKLIRGDGGTVLTVGFITIFVVGVLLALFVSFLVNFASMYIILEEEHIGRSLADAWRLFREHWLVSVEMALLVLFFQAIVGFASIVVFELAFLPMIGFAYAGAALGISMMIPVGLVICYILAFGTILWLWSVFTTFAVSAWTILYIHLKSERGVQGFLKRVWRFAFAR